MLRDSDATVFCWAMGLTQHRNAVATIKEVCNLAFAQGNIGKPGAGLFPVRGHSNVQGDRTMGIWERAPEHFLDALQKEFGFDPPRPHGLDTVDSIRALRDGKAHFFLGLGGNFVQAVSDTDVVVEAMRKARMTVHISTKINRSHLVCGETALILPTKGRTEKDIQASGPQWISVEDSTCSVHSSKGPLEPASPHLKSEVEIITRIAEATIGDRHGIAWKDMRDNYSVIRKHISRVVPGCESYEVNVHRPGGCVMPHPPRDSRTFDTKSGKAEFVVSPIEVLQVPEGHLILQTLRSHDQFNTTIYGLSDRYRGIEGGRRVIFLHRDDISHLGFHNGDFVDITTRWDDDDRIRRADSFRIVEYDTPRGSAAAYYPETNPLVPLDSTAIGSNCPTSKSVIVSLTLARAGNPPAQRRPGLLPTRTTSAPTGRTRRRRNRSTCPDRTGPGRGVLVEREHPRFSDQDLSSERDPFVLAAVVALAGHLGLDEADHRAIRPPGVSQYSADVPVTLIRTTLPSSGPCGSQASTQPFHSSLAFALSSTTSAVPNREIQVALDVIVTPTCGLAAICAPCGNSRSAKNHMSPSNSTSCWAIGRLMK